MFDPYQFWHRYLFLPNISADHSMKVSMREQQMQGVSRRDESNPEDAIHFYALCLHEAGMIKSNPQKIISKGSDWRFLTEITPELNG